MASGGFSVSAMNAAPARALEQTTPRIDSQMPCPTCQQPLIFDEVFGWVHARPPTATGCIPPRPAAVRMVSGR